ncbi:FitA-like ribbon-helix-helix domain-containing protein [Meiothermus cerbereus]|jgi:plasmid stability protein|uniref:FitA-like ribbon-helix-helix domain-containing protein n=1 Tax=Meiothermus cerbereus TaxID=65552 RepID=UPI0004862F51|nr:plasmid stabilization protein [Meiothermus cerbereus]
MASLTIRNLDETTKQALRLRTARHGVSMEEEARRILKSALEGTQLSMRLGSHLRERFRAVADSAFELPERQTPRKTPRWDESA